MTPTQTGKEGDRVQPDLEEQYDKIYRYCYYRVKDAHLAEDLTQETFLRCLESDSYADAEQPLAFLYTVARNLCVDEFRKKKPQELPEGLQGESTEERLVGEITLRMALEELKDRERELVLLRYVNEVPAAALAKLFGVSRFSLYRETKGILKKLERRISDERP